MYKFEILKQSYVMDEVDILINVFTLNCWGIPFISKHRNERMRAIAMYLSKGLHDIVCLQEVWDENDFFHIRDTTSSALPYSQYFYSGVKGSGLCILSKWPIEEVFFHAWPLNGYVHMIHHGDWFGGKGVALCKIKYNDLKINVYSAHLHAEYSTEDIYLAHRVLQAFNTAEFIKLTSYDADVTILAGDLNTRPSDLAFKIICETDKLTDACASMNSKLDSDNKICLGTNERASNSYTNPVEGAKNPDGIRIDYILYHAGQNYVAQVNKYEMPISGKVPDCEFSYSDHEAVAAQLKVIKAPNNQGNYIPPKEYVATLDNAILVCRDALLALKQSARRYMVFAVTLLLILFGTVGMAERSYVDFPRLLLVVVMFYFIFMGTLWNCMERNGVLSGLQAMEIIYKNLINNKKDT